MIKFKCPKCSHEFDPTGIPEKSAGVVACPECQADVTQAQQLTGKAVALTGISTQIAPAASADLWIVYIPKGDRTVEQKDGGKLRVNPTELSAKRMEAARQLLAKKGGNQPYTDFNHDDREASGRPLRFAFDGNLGVIGLTRRTPRAVELTAGDPPEFQAFSPHVPIDSDTGEALGLYMNCGGFVNRPLFGDSTSLSAAAHLQHELVAADPNDVALVSAAPDIVEHTNAAEKEKPTMKELIAKLCAAWKIAKPVDQVTEAELITAFDQSTQETAALTGKVALVEPVITALGYAKDATPKAEELTGKITELNQRPANVDELIGREIADFAAATGIIAPAEEADWRDKLKKDRVNRTKELVGKTPSVLIGKLITEQRTTPPAADDTFKEAQELVAKDPAFKAIAEKQGADIALGRAVEAVLVKKQKM